MSLNKSPLEGYYKATTFRVETADGPIDLRIGENNPGIDDLLTKHKATEWAYITAWNPGSLPLPADENALAHKKLLQIIQDRGFVHHLGEGIPDQDGWAPERSVWIAGMGRQDAVKVGRQFGQKAIVVGSLGGLAKLVFCEV